MTSRLPPAFSKHLKVTLPARQVPGPGQHADDDAIVRQAAEQFRNGFAKDADRLCGMVLARNPRNPQALHLAGRLALDAGQHDLAIQYLENAVRERPKEPLFHLALAETYLSTNEPEKASRHFRRALAIKPDLVRALVGLGRALASTNDAEQAVSIFEKALAIDPEHMSVRGHLADALTSLGRTDEGVATLKQAITLGKDVPRAYNILARSKTYAGDPEELKSIADELARPGLYAEAAYQLHHAAGKILNDLKRYDEAIDHISKAKAAVGYDFDIETYRRWINSMIALFSRDRISTWDGFGNPSEVPVFVLGMPRSGTTLIEQICASHPGVHGAGELYQFARVATSIGLNRTSLAPFAQSVSDMTREQSRALASDYLSYVRRLSPDALRVVDKMPHNFETVGLIALLFPHARIIHCRRDPIDTCVSCFMTDFNSMHGYTANLQKLGLYYREYDRLMQHWETVLPGRLYTCRYEDVVTDPTNETRRLLEHLGLEWDDACLRFYDQSRTVNTPSQLQVRQPIYSSSVKRWKNYGSAIQPLIDALGDLAEA